MKKPTKPEPKSKADPEPEPKEEPKPKPKRKPHIERYIGEDFNWRVRLVAANGERILNNDPYDSASNAQRAAEVAAEQLGLEIIVLDDPDTKQPQLEC